MLFSEPTFLFLFLPVVVLLYALLPVRFRNGFLTVASLLFYASGEAAFLPFLLASVALNYYFAIWIANSKGTRRAAWILWAGIASDLGLLLVFKYTHFLIHNWNALAPIWHGRIFTLGRIALPLGISFFTFHKISYKVDVFRGHAEAKRNPLDLALYILFFPQLIAGPIVRYNEIAGQFGAASRTLDWGRLTKGAQLFIVGLGKKMLIANVLAAPADRIFALPAESLPTSVSWLGIACYSLQIYFDFSGYSDMAVGLACLFGFDFPRNFNFPYCADSITEFWRRWHISLSTWFRDYLYIPLGGNRQSPARTYLNLLVVFLLCGFWHGASWNFVVWGVFHGSFLVGERAFGLRHAAGASIVRRAYTLLVVMLGWVCFRASSMHEAGRYVVSLSGFGRASGPVCNTGLFMDRHVAACLLIGIIASTPAARILWISWTGANPKSPEDLPPAARWAAPLLTAGLAACFLLSAMEVLSGTYNPFIYFRF